MGYLILKPTLQKNNSGTSQPVAGGDKLVRTFSKGISPKLNVIA